MIFFLIFTAIATTISLSNTDPAPTNTTHEYREPNGGNNNGK